MKIFDNSFVAHHQFCSNDGAPEMRDRSTHPVTTFIDQTDLIWEACGQGHGGSAVVKLLHP